MQVAQYSSTVSNSHLVLPRGKTVGLYVQHTEPCASGGDGGDGDCEGLGGREGGSGDGVHMVGVGLGGAGLATVLVAVAVAQRWRTEWAWAFLCIAPIVATVVALPSDSVGFFVAEVVATFGASLFFPLIDLAHSGAHIVIAI